MELDSGDGSLAIGDFTGDGKLDVASGAAGVLLLGNGDGTFQPPAPLGAAGTGLAAGDFARNGKLDLADTGVTVLRNTSPDCW
jgi:ATP-dependent exoDNAse (exonuclease V) alpha subunit